MDYNFFKYFSIFLMASSPKLLKNTFLVNPMITWVGKALTFNSTIMLLLLPSSPTC